MVSDLFGCCGPHCLQIPFAVSDIPSKLYVKVNSADRCLIRLAQNRKNAMNKIKWAFVWILSLVLVLLVVQNTASVEAHFLGFTTEMSLVVLLFLTGSLGFVSGLVLGFLLKSRNKPSSGEQGKNEYL